MKILIYSDSKIFGGHEIMLIKIINCLIKLSIVNKIYLVIPSSNIRLNSCICGMNNDNLILYRMPYTDVKLNAIRSLFSPIKIIKIIKIFRKINPDIAVISQGRIELGVLGLLASKILKYKTISYIPMGHTFKEMGKKSIFGFREIINKFLYKLPDEYITISDNIKSQIARFSNNNINIVHNIVDELSDLKKININDARNNLNLPHKYKLIGIIGRIDFGQKCQNRLIELILMDKKFWLDYKFVIVGDGRDLEKLKKLIKINNLQSYFIFTGWIEDKVSLYSAINALMVLSRFEGVPLVILEAIHFNVKIFGTRIDGLIDYINSEFLFDPSNLCGAKNIILNLFNENFLVNNYILSDVTDYSTFESEIQRALFSNE